MRKRELVVAVMACLLLLGSIIAVAFEEFESSEGKVVEVKSQEKLVSLASGLNFGSNNTIYVMASTSSNDNFTLPINRSTNHQTNESAVNGSLRVGANQGTRVAIRASNGQYVCAEDGGGRELVASRNAIGPWEIFQIEVQDSIQQVIDAAGPGGTVKLVDGVYKGTATIDKSVNIVGSGTGGTSIDGGRQGSVFTIGKTNPDIDVGLCLIGIRGGSSEYGGSINNFGRLTLDDILITGNTASNSGGGIFNHGSMFCTAALISNNAAKLGGGIFNDAGSGLILETVNITSNTAEIRGGGILNKGKMNFMGGIVWRNYRDNIWDDTANANVGHRPSGNLSALNVFRIRLPPVYIGF